MYFYVWSLMTERLGNKKTFEINQAKIVVALDKAKYKGLTRAELMEKTGISTRRRLRKHLKILKNLLSESKMVDGKNRFYLKGHFDSLKTETLHKHEAWSSLSHQIFDLGKVEGVIPINTDYGEFFKKHGVLFYPVPTANGFKELYVFCSIEKPESPSETFQIKLLWDIHPFSS